MNRGSGGSMHMSQNNLPFLNTLPHTSHAWVHSHTHTRTHTHMESKIQDPVPCVQLVRNVLLLCGMVCCGVVWCVVTDL